MANDNGTGLARSQGAPLASTSEGFGSTEMVRANETSTTAVAAQARAKIEARYIVAMKNPRSWDDVRAKLLKDCLRPGFAAVARYAKPVGRSKIEGPSIRFAEAALRSMGNAVVETAVVWEDDDKRIVRVSVTDIESNLPYEADVVVSKTVERRQLKDGQQALATRLNSYGDKVYIVQATDDDLLNKQNALVSKALRTAALRLLPGDILEDCMDAVMRTQHNQDAADPDAARKKLIDAFAALNIMPAQLSEYLGHDIAQVVTAELADLRTLYVAIRDGETTWGAVMESRKPETTHATPTQSAAAGVKAKIAAKKGAAQKAADKPSQGVIDTTADDSTDDSKLDHPPAGE